MLFNPVMHEAAECTVSRGSKDKEKDRLADRPESDLKVWRF